MFRILIPTNKEPLFLQEKLFAINHFANFNQVKIAIHIQSNGNLNATDLELDYTNIELTFAETLPKVITAEENLLIGLRNLSCGYAWTWILGDDDYFDLNLFTQILATCAESPLGEKFNVINLNNNLYTNTRKPVFSDKLITKNADVLSVEDFILANGVISSSAGFSNWLVYVSEAEIAEFEKFLQRQIRIYWHVPWILELASKMHGIRRIDTPLLDYSLNLHDTDESKHWRNYASQVSIKQDAPWGENLLDLITHLVNSKIINISNIKFITERDSHGKNYNLGEFIVYKTLNQITTLMHEKDTVEAEMLAFKLRNFAYSANLFPAPVAAELFRATVTSAVTAKEFNIRIKYFQQLIEIYKENFGNFTYGWNLYWRDNFVVINYRNNILKLHSKCLPLLSFENIISLEIDIQKQIHSICFCDDKNSDVYLINSIFQNRLRQSKLFMVYKKLPKFARKYIRTILNID